MIPPMMQHLVIRYLISRYPIGQITFPIRHLPVQLSKHPRRLFQIVIYGSIGPAGPHMSQSAQDGCLLSEISVQHRQGHLGPQAVLHQIPGRIFVIAVIHQADQMCIRDRNRNLN